MDHPTSVIVFCVVAAWLLDSLEVNISCIAQRFDRPVDVAILVLSVLAVPQELKLVLLFVSVDRHLNVLAVQLHKVCGSLDLFHHALVLVS